MFSRYRGSYQHAECVEGFFLDMATSRHPLHVANPKSLLFSCEIMKHKILKLAESAPRLQDVPTRIYQYRIHATLREKHTFAHSDATPGFRELTWKMEEGLVEYKATLLVHQGLNQHLCFAKQPTHTTTEMHNFWVRANTVVLFALSVLVAMATMCAMSTYVCSVSLRLCLPLSLSLSLFPRISPCVSVCLPRIDSL